MIKKKTDIIKFDDLIVINEIDTTLDLNLKLEIFNLFIKSMICFEDLHLVTLKIANFNKTQKYLIEIDIYNVDEYYIIVSNV